MKKMRVPTEHDLWTSGHEDECETHSDLPKKFIGL